MSGRVQGKIALVTGAAAGLGGAIAKRLAEEGARVIITDLKDEQGLALAKEIGATYRHQDVTDEDGWKKLVASIVADMGGLDIVVNNAGLAASHGNMDPENTRLDDFRKIYTVNVEGVFLGCKHTIPVMAKNGGSIINMSSIGALVPTPFITAYGASKAAVAHLTRSVALHCAERGYAIRCNSVHPGQIRTPMHVEMTAHMAREANAPLDALLDAFLAKIPMRQFQEAIDIANAVLYLASDEARYVTGTQIVVDGGMSLVS
jgi:3(or 17)beta-hydroxysteroid dehydrogenase